MDGPEPDYQKSYQDWSLNPTPASTGALLNTLDPVIRKGVANYGSGKNDPLMVSRARRLTLKAVQSYDPQQGTKLTTHINNHLQGLRRVARQQQQVLRVPERVSLDQAYLREREMELADKLGRTPSTTELADHAGMSVHKIARTRRYNPGLPEGMLDAAGGEAPLTGQTQMDRRTMQLAGALHGDLDARDQQIMEMSLGMFGHRKYQTHEIATKIGITPSAISQRKQAIQQKLDTLLQAL